MSEYAKPNETTQETAVSRREFGAVSLAAGLAAAAGAPAGEAAERPVVLQRRQYGQAALLRQIQIEQDDVGTGGRRVRPLAPQVRQRLLAIITYCEVIRRLDLPQGLSHQHRVAAPVFDQKNAHWLGS